MHLTSPFDASFLLIVFFILRFKSSFWASSILSVLSVPTSSHASRLTSYVYRSPASKLPDNTLMARTTLKTRWSLKHKILTLFYAFKDKRTPLYAKIATLSSIIYLVSPADILPDVIPLAGYIDDIVIVPFLIDLSTKLLPAEIKKDAEQKARSRGKKVLWLLLIMVVAITVALYFIFRN
jgi:uncharacterized membrane protein YkvA (DUF1232 family)